MQLRILHRTAYRYDEPVKYSAQALRLTPRREGQQHVLSWAIHAPGRRIEQLDAHGNVTHLLTLEEPHKAIEIVVAGAIEISHDGGLMPHEGPLSPLAYLASTPLTAADAAITSLAQQYMKGSGRLRDCLLALAAGVQECVRYQKGSTTVEDTAAAALARGKGVCQDQAHVFIAACRASGIPARYVSGYLYDEAVVEEGSAAASHAWVDAWLGDANAWLGVDVTHCEPTGARHCRLAVGRDYLDAAPVRGVRRGGGREMMDVDVTVAKASDQ
ncbi:MAG TPA: transglutaminase family protein [Steroidobacteraceae bacterium]|nr:transglutaminase family protein [Steroidobacteraceae bacterium]